MSPLSNPLILALCRDITEKHRRLAEITEMIHTASLMHDDVVDESPVRRGLLHCTICVQLPFYQSHAACLDHH